MSRRRRSQQKEAPKPTASTTGEQPRTHQSPQGTNARTLTTLNPRRIVLAVILVVFVLFQALIILFFRSGESIRWKRELVTIEDHFAAGRLDRAARELQAFGERWPGARDTLEWNRRMGIYLSQIEEFDRAAQHFLRAAEIAPGEPGIHALAGEALWKAGQHEAATESLAREIQQIDRASGDHDRANYYLGLYLLQQERYVEAMQHFQSVIDREQWSEGLDDAYARIDRELLEPARQKARETAAP